MVRRLLTSLRHMYRPRFVWTLIEQYAHHGYDISAYTKWFWQAKQHVPLRQYQTVRRTVRDWWIIFGLSVVGILLLTAGSIFVFSGLFSDFSEQIWFGLAVLVSLPLVLALMVPYFDVVYRVVRLVLHPKQLGREIICWQLERQVVQLRKRYDFKIIVVAGSMGKSSTKLAVAQVIEAAGISVQYQKGNYNDRVTVPLVVFGHELPGLFNILAWVRIFKQNQRIIRGGYPYEMVVLEIGTDGPGQLRQFAYLRPELAIITAVAPEHMEYFGTLDAVAEEEMSIVPFAQDVLLNSDDIAEHYIPHHDYEQYGLTHREKGYYAEAERVEPTGQELNLYKHGNQWATQYVSFLGTQGRKVVLAAAAAADMLAIDRSKIAAGLTGLKPMAGRMQLLQGIKDSVLIDDSYNATPAAVEAALTVLAALPNKQRIAVLGSMNELGAFSAEAHRTIGESINPDAISLVVTIGADARDYIAPAAEARGCTVLSFMNPHEAGMKVKEVLQAGAAVLVKGSQNGVFSEEALKPLLKNPDDASLLVRQSNPWMQAKRQQFTLPQ